VASRAAKERCDAGFGVNKTGEAVYLDFSAAIERYGKLEANVKKIDNPSKEKIIELGRAVVSEKYGNLFDMYENIVGENPYDHAMKIYPAVHYTMGGLWVDYNLQTTVPGLFALGEANFSDHGANRLGASALMQGLADGYFVIPYTVGDYLADDIRTGPIDTKRPEFDAAEKDVKDRINHFLNNKGTKPVDDFHRSFGQGDVGQVRHGSQRRRLETSDPGDPGHPRGFLAERTRTRQRQCLQPRAGKSRSCGRFSRVGGADVHGRTGPQ
jgi:succinate dehydrogenase / fumarate reductase flavoprotein subunit